jgi:hypothetical protein
MVLIKTYDEIPFCDKEILRYAQCDAESLETVSLLNFCKSEALEHMRYKVCYCELPLEIDGEICHIGSIDVCSKNLSKNLGGCSRVIVFAASIGIGIDRLISKYSKISPAKALFFQAIGSERAESLCEAFCKDIVKEYGTMAKPRFSPGYGDLSLSTQKNIFALLDCERKIGVTLNDSMLMSPSKSVTAFLGLN